jgi:hypothetical protein
MEKSGFARYLSAQREYGAHPHASCPTLIQSELNADRTIFVSASVCVHAAQHLLKAFLRRGTARCGEQTKLIAARID